MAVKTWPVIEPSVGLLEIGEFSVNAPVIWFPGNEQPDISARQQIGTFVRAKSGILLCRRI